MAERAVTKVGDKHHLLTVIEILPTRSCGRIMVKCLCDCGKETVTPAAVLRAGRTKSCGCFKTRNLKTRARIHGDHGSSTYSVWQRIRSKCNNPNNINYHKYGGKGIRVDPEWNNFEQFKRDVGEYPGEGYRLGRKDIHGNFSKDNCVWIA